jgi:hypothetical protein
LENCRKPGGKLATLWRRPTTVMSCRLHSRLHSSRGFLAGRCALEFERKLSEMILEAAGSDRRQIRGGFSREEIYPTFSLPAVRPPVRVSGGKWTAFDRRLIKEGWSLANIGQHLGVSPTSINYRLRQAGVQLRARRGRGARQGKRGLMFLCAVPSLLWCAGRRLVQAHGRADQRPERVLVDRFALVEIDCAPDVAIEARVEKA